MKQSQHKMIILLMGVYELTGDMKYQKLHSDHVSLQVSYSFGQTETNRHTQLLNLQELCMNLQG